jgi:hypothetical protein
MPLSKSISDEQDLKTSFTIFGKCIGRRIVGKKLIFLDVIECEEP